MKKLSDLLSEYAKVLETTPHYLSQYSLTDILRTLDVIEPILDFTKESNEKNKNDNLDFEELNFFKIRLLARLRTIKENQRITNQLSLEL